MEPQARSLLPVAAVGWALILLAGALMTAVGPLGGEISAPQIVLVIAFAAGLACGAGAFVAALLRLLRGQRGAAVWVPLGLGLVPALLLLLAIATLLGAPSKGA